MAFNLDAIGKTFGPSPTSYDWRRVALYALGCGADRQELDLLLESRGPRVLPTYCVVLAHDTVSEALHALGGNMLTLVHGSQRCVRHAPMPSEGTVNTDCKIEALYDKGKGALAVLTSRTTSEDGQLLAETEWGIFYRGEGGFGGERGPEAPAYAPPEGQPPDHEISMPTAPTQALLYRLASFDLNPIHSDPAIAQQAGFDAPILHGLSTFGHAARAAINAVCDSNADRLASIEGRFSRPVFPGETIVTKLWMIDDHQAVFESSVAERQAPAITLGRVTIDDEP